MQSTRESGRTAKEKEMLYIERNLSQRIKDMESTMLLLLPSAIREATTPQLKINKKQEMLTALHICYNSIKSDIEFCFNYGDLNYDRKNTLLANLEATKEDWTNRINSITR